MCGSATRRSWSSPTDGRPAALARHDARHHRSEGGRGEAALEPRGAAAHDPATPGAGPAAGERAGGRERRRIAADIHDDPIQVMSALDMRLQMLTGLPERDHARRDREVEQEIVASRSNGSAPCCSSFGRPRSTATAWSRRSASTSTTRAKERAGPSRWQTSSPPSPTPSCGAALPDRAGGGRQRSQARPGAAVRSMAVSVADGAIVRVIDDGVGFHPDLICRARAGPSSGCPPWSSAPSSLGGWCGSLSTARGGHDGRMLAPGGHHRGRSRLADVASEASDGDEPASS